MISGSAITATGSGSGSGAGSAITVVTVVVVVVPSSCVLETTEAASGTAGLVSGTAGKTKVLEAAAGWVAGWSSSRTESEPFEDGVTAVPAPWDGGAIRRTEPVVEVAGCCREEP